MVDMTNNEEQPVILTFKMSLENVNGLIDILTTLPFGQVAGYIQSIRAQAMNQLKASE